MLEQKVDDIIPDILVTCDGKRFIVEIYVTHAVDDEKKQKIQDLQISAVEIDLSRFHHEMIDKEILKQELCNTDNFSWVYDADRDLIEQKKAVIQQFGMKIQIDPSGYVKCPFASQKTGGLPCFTNFRFCKGCSYCCNDKQQGYVRCAFILPTPLNLETRKRIYLDIIVNDNKVMFTSEFREYDSIFLKKMFANTTIRFPVQLRLR